MISKLFTCPFIAAMVKYFALQGHDQEKNPFERRQKVVEKAQSADARAEKLTGSKNSIGGGGCSVLSKAERGNLPSIHIEVFPRQVFPRDGPKDILKAFSGHLSNIQCLTGLAHYNSTHPQWHLRKPSTSSGRPRRVLVRTGLTS